MITAPSDRTIAIVGGGLSGLLLAANLLHSAEAPLRVIAIERRRPIGCGVAYRTTVPEHLLNVPAGGMSAWPKEPNHFVDWLRQQRGQGAVVDPAGPDDFVSRGVYARYLQQVLTDARAAARPQVRYFEIEGEAVDLEERAGGGGLLKLGDGRAVEADQVVLALGNLPGEYPIQRPLPIYRTDRYVHVPWQGNALDGLGPDEEVLLVGQGLTASDLIVQLARSGHRGTIHALSRHGIPPRCHAPAAADGWEFPLVEPPKTVRELVRHVRGQIRAAAVAGRDWRAVIDGLRPHAQNLWLALSWAERARFMRHVRPLWEVHRHRVAPQVGAKLDALVAAGRLKYYAGRLQTLEADASGVHALIRHRGSIRHQDLRVARVINCTGPRTDYSKYQHPLFVHLLARGLIDHDPLALGINALPTGEVLRYRGGPTGWLYTLGPPLKGVLWESTAVPEIRVQASALATRLQQG